MAQARRWRQLTLVILLAWWGALPATAEERVAPQRWEQLTPAQRDVLAPLAREWHKLGPKSRARWLAIAARYPSLSPDEQVRVTARMQEWAALTPEQRRKAREQYKRLLQLPGDQRPALGQKWDQYQSLPQEKKSDLRGRAPRMPASDLYRPVPATWLVAPYLRHPSRPAPPTFSLR